MQITIIGGHGKVALQAAPLLVRDGHEVRAVIRREEHAEDVRATGAVPVVADVQELDTEDLVDLLAGSQAVLWSAGAGGGDPERTYAVDRDAAIRSMDAAVAAGADRYVMVSYFGASPDHGVPTDDPFHAYAEAKGAADDHLRSSSLDWTVLGPSGLTDEAATGTVAVDLDGSLQAGQVSRADVAEVAAQALGRADLAGTTIRFNGGETPIPEALDAVAAGQPG